MKAFWRTVLLLMLSAALILCICGCGQKGDGDDLQTGDSYEAVEIDLTQMSKTAAYVKAHTMVESPNDYEGKSVRIQGVFGAYVDPATQNIYYACLLTDEDACCNIPIEFVAEDLSNLPKQGEQITVSGVFGTYTEEEKQYCRLTDAVIE